MPVTPQNAATVVLMRDSSTGGMPEVLLVRRDHKANFAAGMYVFPGGMLEANDYSQAALKLSQALTPDGAARRMAGLDDEVKGLGLFVAAIRETFEEVGILLSGEAPAGATDIAKDVLNSARERIYRGELDFISWMGEQGLTLATGELVYFAHWITPVDLPKRFDTRFFLVQVAAGVAVDVDGREVFDGVWLSPAQALEKHAREELRFMHPTLANLELLAAYSSTKAAFLALAEQEVPTILPKSRQASSGETAVKHPLEMKDLVSV